MTGEEEICPAKATLLGVCKSIPQEYPNIICRSVDVVVQAGDESSSKKSAAELIAELSGDRAHPIVAYRAGQRWVQIFEPLRLEKSADAASVLHE